MKNKIKKYTNCKKKDLILKKSLNVYSETNQGGYILFTQPLRSGRIWHKVNF